MAKPLAKTNYPPIALPFFGLFFVLLVLLVALLEIGVLQYTYEQLGIGPRYFMGLMLASLLGSTINLPIAEVHETEHAPPGTATHLGMVYPIPPAAGARTIIAVNLGGAVVPTLLSIALILLHGLYLSAVAAVAIVALVTHRLARPVRGVGIAVPVFVPPVVAALVALALRPSAAPALAYAAGTLGTLIGADLLNLGRVRGLGAPVVSIGGAGTFDGVFLTGIIAVLIA
jgi:uncharacterized membrane protein